MRASEVWRATGTAAGDAISHSLKISSPLSLLLRSRLVPNVQSTAAREWARP
jgi:hypothetical protein